MSDIIPAKQGAALISFDQLQQMGAAIAKSGLFGMKTPDQAVALMLVAQAEGLHPATIAQDYDIIQGRAARKSHSVLARFQAAGGSVQWHEMSESKAEATFSHPQGGSVTIDWTFEMAKRIGLTGKDNWKNYPRAMLRARCIAEGVRAVYPAALGGSLIDAEAQDLALIDGETGEVIEPPKPSGPRRKSESAPKPQPEPQEQPARSQEQQPQPQDSGDTPKINAGQVKYLESKLAAVGIDAAVITNRFGIASLADLNVLQFDELRAELVAAS